MAKFESNIDLVIDFIDNAINSLDENINESMDEILEDAVIEIKQQWPVDTGTSKAGWTHQQLGNGIWSVINNVDYAEFVHDGLADEIVTKEILKSINNHINDMEIFNG